MFIEIIYIILISFCIFHLEFIIFVLILILYYFNFLIWVIINNIIFNVLKTKLLFLEILHKLLFPILSFFIYIFMFFADDLGFLATNFFNQVPPIILSLFNNIVRLIIFFLFFSFSIDKF